MGKQKIPVLEPVTGGIGVPADTPFEYSSGDGSLKEIQEPLPGLGERYGIAPKVDGVEDPSANVAAAPEMDLDDLGTIGQDVVVD